MGIFLCTKTYLSRRHGITTFFNGFSFALLMARLRPWLHQNLVSHPESTATWCSCAHRRRGKTERLSRVPTQLILLSRIRPSSNDCNSGQWPILETLPVWAHFAGPRASSRWERIHRGRHGSSLNLTPNHYDSFYFPHFATIPVRNCSMMVQTSLLLASCSRFLSCKYLGWLLVHPYSRDYL